MSPFKLALLLVIPFLLQEPGSVKKRNKPLQILEKRLSMTVHPSEILESVISRIEGSTSESIDYRVDDLLPYNAKSKVYEHATVKEIMEDQLHGTPITYRIHKKKLIIYKLEK